MYKDKPRSRKHLLVNAVGGECSEYHKHHMYKGQSHHSGEVYKDLEPWRCNRTNGKTWRCSRNIVLHKKYCDRHMTRTRKRVEVHLVGGECSKYREHHMYKDKPRSRKHLLVNAVGGECSEYHEHHMSKGQSHHSGEMYKDLEPWKCKRTNGKTWRCSRNVVLHQKYCDRHMTRTRKLVEVHTPSTAKKNAITTITTTTNGNKNMLSFTSKSDISLSSLNLSNALADGNTLDDKMGLGLTDSDDGDGIGGGDKSQDLRWQLSHVPLMDQLLQRTMQSLSHNNGCSSPTLEASTATPNIMGFHRLN